MITESNRIVGRRPGPGVSPVTPKVELGPANIKWCEERPVCDAAGMSPLQQRTLVAGIWVALHVLVAGSPLRRVIAGKIGEGGCAGLFSLPW